MQGKPRCRACALPPTHVGQSPPTEVGYAVAARRHTVVPSQGTSGARARDACADGRRPRDVPAGLKQPARRARTRIQVDSGRRLAVALQLVRLTAYDLLLLDWHLAEHDGDALAGQLRDDGCAARIVVLSGEARPCADRAQRRARCCRASSPRPTAPQMMMAALTQVLAGRIFLPAEGDARRPRGDAVRALPTRGWPALTPRQIDVYRAAARGLPNKLIARELGITEATVKTHLTAVYRRARRAQPHRSRDPGVARRRADCVVAMVVKRIVETFVATVQWPGEGATRPVPSAQPVPDRASTEAHEADVQRRVDARCLESMLLWLRRTPLLVPLGLLWTWLAWENGAGAWALAWFAGWVGRRPTFTGRRGSCKGRPTAMSGSPSRARRGSTGSLASCTPRCCRSSSSAPASKPSWASRCS